ncbi:MAG TPA: TolC family protein, partial [Candidatus Saccharimonadales bacterium]|nr:TolC family protein [Candidatus Saccharimonadales bacterium]
MKNVLLFPLSFALIAGPCFAQAAEQVLPNAPSKTAPHSAGAKFSAFVTTGQTSGVAVAAADPVLLAQATPPPAGSHPNAPAAPTTTTNGLRLTLAEAEKMALAHNPNMSVAHLLQLAQQQVTREARAGFLPQITSNLTAVGAAANSRITGGGTLNSPRVLDKAAGGLTASQLITDFGRTRNLLRNAQSNARAQLETERATTEDITLAVDQAYYQALTAQQVLREAQQTVKARQATGEQIGAL